jgi:formate hydrogenlyase subunit 3/multisubunit Na+/H+ antiporter MnhD subunit
VTLILTALAIWFTTGVLCLALARRPRLVQAIGPAGAVAGSLPALVDTSRALLGGSVAGLHQPWSIPGANFAIGMDALSALFTLPMVLICALAAVYGRDYLRPYEGRKALGVSWFMFNLLAASMLLVVLARNAVLFLLAWEAMSFSSFFLVLFEHEEAGVARAGWTYLVATHIGTAFLLVLFVLLGQPSGSLDFEGFAQIAGTPYVASLAFVLAVVGFGTKAGFMPFHVWLPEAHPAAPSHVSAVMSGVMIKTGIYGLVRTLLWLGPPQLWWGYLLVGIGAVSGVLGVLFALAQHDLKRLLAYHSVENIGIIVLGLGVGLIGLGSDLPLVAALGFAGGLLHVVNHAIFKSLLFLDSGSVLHATGTREIDHLGGLLKSMPTTGATFLVGAAAISGLPPLNGFVSEFLIYFAAFSLLGAAGIPVIVAALVVIVSLALIGGLAAACFTKAFGTIFLGQARSSHAGHAHEAGPSMRVPLVLLAGLCLVIGVSAPLVIGVLAPVVSQLAGATDPGDWARTAAGPLAVVAWVGAGLLALAAILAAVRSALLARRSVEESGTWDCGYSAPTPRMQYTASSFADPLTRFFGPLLGTRRKLSAPDGFFPQSASCSTETPDMSRERFYKPVFLAVQWGLSKFQWLQHGRLNFYILYIVLTLLALLAWKLGTG